MSNLDKYLDSYRAMEKALSTTIRIDHRQVDFIVVNRLIGIRNSPIQDSKVIEEMDAALRFFLTEDEFEKYVINQEPIEDEN